MTASCSIQNKLLMPISDAVCAETQCVIWRMRVYGGWDAEGLFS